MGSRGVQFCVVDRSYLFANVCLLFLPISFTCEKSFDNDLTAGLRFLSRLKLIFELRWDQSGFLFLPHNIPLDMKSIAKKMSY